jgi:phosphoenolpyruvate---glycerone phosphotransferase subunit DhaL
MVGAVMERQKFHDLISAVCQTMIAHTEDLTTLDQAIGDGDHGLNMKRGCEAVQADIDMIINQPFGDALRDIGTKLVMTIGGASGPLYGTLFLALGKSCPTIPDRNNLIIALKNAIDAVAARGKSAPGQKTMLDVLYPAWESFSVGKPLRDVAIQSANAALATAPMLATRGRASFLGARSIGHIDPGARSSALLISTITDTLGETN